MKLEIGMYYRYKGQIGKYKKITELDRYPSFTNNYLRVADTILLNNTKFSYNIIDLIEEGDYVNGKKIVGVGCLTNGPREGTKVIDYDITPNAVCYLVNEDIKSVITHEQIEQMEYKVGENNE